MMCQTCVIIYTMPLITQFDTYRFYDPKPFQNTTSYTKTIVHKIDWSISTKYLRRMTNFFCAKLPPLRLNIFGVDDKNNMIIKHEKLSK